LSKDIIEPAKKALSSAKDYWADIYKLAKDDLNFLSGKEGCQWDTKAFTKRTNKNRPALQIDRLTQYVNQVSNDVRMNTPSINVIPHGGAADIETAEVYQGLIRDIEDKSGADDAYDYAVNMSIKSSIGFIRVDHRYVDNSSFDQELVIERVVNPLAVYLDPNSVTPDGSDAKCAWILEDMPISAFKEQYPDFEVSSFGDETELDDKADTVTVCEYFKIKEKPIMLALLRDNSVVEYEEGAPLDVVDTREGVKKVVYRYHLSGKDVLKETTFPGDYIPIVPVYGEEAWIDGKRHIQSLIRKAKDSQRRYNFWASTEAELLMKAPKATIIAVGGTTENYADDYKDPDNAIVLRYDQTDAKGNPAPPPQLNPGPQIPSGIVNAMGQASEDIKATLGLYDAFLGQRSNETSGVAIRERKLEGDRAVYHYGDNLVRSITQIGRVLVSAIPTIYSTPRIVNIIGKEETTDKIGINGAMIEGQERPFFLAEGQYNVTVTTGASHATMRQEAAEFFQQIVQTQPELLQVAGDLMFKYMDFPGAQALSERIKKTIPPQLLDEETQDPQTAALQQENEQLKQAMSTMQAELQNKQADLNIKMMSEQNEAQDSATKNQVEMAKLRLEQEKIQKDYEIKVAELALKRRELALKETQAVVAAQQNAVAEMSQSSDYYQEEELS
jgi:hypothetical protein